MKKLTALILTLSMLLSMCVVPMGASAAEITEAERQEILNATDYQYVDLSPVANRDLFATFEDIGTYSRFNKSASGSTSTAKDTATYTFTAEVGGVSKEITVYDWLPISTDVAYDDVNFYKKGFSTDKATVNGVYMLDDLLSPDGTVVTTTEYSGGNNSTSKQAASGEVTRIEAKRTVKSSHVIDRVTENGKQYAIIKNAGIQHKVGPLSADTVSPNAVYLTNTAVNVPVNMSGNTLSVLFLMGNIHSNSYNSAHTAIGAGPLIGIQKVSLYYEGDATAHDKYMFVEFNAEADYNANFITKKPFVSRAVVYVPKNTDGSEITKDDFYNSDASKRKTFKYVTEDTASEHGIDVATFDPNKDIVFPNDKYVVTERAQVAAIVKQRQGIVSNNYSNSVNLINIPLDNKVLTKVAYKTDYTLKNYDGAEWIGTVDTARQGIIPVEIPSASQDYEYFIYTGSIANTSSMLGMTVVGESIQDKIDAVNAEIEAAETIEDLVEAKSAANSLIAENEIVLEKDFKFDLLNSKVKASIDAEIEAATTVEALEAVNTALDGYASVLNIDVTEFKAAVTAKIAEINRVENLTEGNKTYIDFVSQVSEAKAATKMDIFSDYQTMADYSMFYTALNSASAFNADMYHNGSAYVEADASYTGTTYKNKIPETTTDGTPITGNEGYYRKGFDTNKNNEAVKNVPFIYDIDSIKNVGGTSTAIYHYNTNNKSSAVAGTVKRSTKLQLIYKSKPDVEKIENTANGEYYYLKDGERTFKLGPAKSLEFSPNAVAAGQTATDAFSVNAKGAYLDLAIGASNINNPGYSNLNIVTSSGGDYSPSIALQAVQVKYASGTETYYIPVWNSAESTKAAILRSIMYAPKKYDEEGNEIAYTATDVYKANTPVTPFTPLADVADIKKDGVDTLTMDDIVCPGGTIVAGEMDVASFVCARQGQFYENSPAVATASIPLKNEELISFTLTGSLASANAAAQTVENAIALSSSSNTSNLNRALIPVEIKGAKEEYVYYLYVGRLANYASSLIGATLRQEPMSVKIAEINEQLAAAETKADIISTLDAMKALVDSSNGAVLVKDFATASATAKLNTYILAEIEAAETNEEVDAIDAEVDGYVSAYGIDATALKAAIAAAKEKFAAERLSQSVYAPIEMDLLNDYFTTLEERKTDNWFADGDYRTYLGFTNINVQIPSIRTARSNNSTLSVNASKLSLNTLATLKDGRYILPVGGVPYRLGPVTEGVIDKNAFTIGEMITKTGAAIADGEENLFWERLDEKYAVGTSSVSATSSSAYKGSEYYQVHAGKFPVDVANTNKVNIVTTSLVEIQPTGTYNLYAVDALVHLDDGSTVGYVLLTAPGFHYNKHRSIEESILFVPTNTETDYSTYSAINGAIGGEVITLEDMADYDVSDIKLPSAPDVKGVAISSSYLKGLTGEKVGKTTQMYYDNVILPESTQELYADRTWQTGAYANSFEITAPEGRTITAVEFIHDGGGTLTYGAATGTYANAVGGLRSADSTAATLLVPATVAGLEGYQAYVRITRNCQYSAVLGMTAETTGTELVANLNTLMANATESDIADIESMKAFIDEDVVSYADLDLTARTKYEKLLADANVSGTITMSFEEGVAAKATVTINNISKLAGKTYKVILAYYDAEGNFLGTKIVDGTSTTDKTKTFEINETEIPEGTKLVKGFIWKDFTTLVPLATADEAAASSYALDNFFDVETGEFKQSEGELNIVFIGDSLTQGATTYDGDDSALSNSEKLHWTKVVSDYFAEQTGRTVNMYNAGVGGVQTSFLTKMISQTVEKTKADIIFIENVNDLNTNTTNSQKWTENLIRNLAKLDKKPVVIMAHAVHPFKEKDLQANHITAKDAVAQAYNLASVNYMQYYYDNTNGFDTTSDWMQTDYGETKIAKSDVHPLPAGYNRFGNYIVSQIYANPSAYITRINPADDVDVMYADTADLEYKLTYPTSSRFTYNGFNLYTSTNKQTGYTTADAEYIINWKYNFPHGGAAQAITTNGGASIEFTTSAKTVEIVHSCPYLANRRADFVVYVDGNEVVNNTTSNTYANVLNTTAVTLDGEGSHKIRVEVKQDSTAVKNVFNFAYIVEQK